MRKYKGYQLCNISAYPSYPIYGVYAPDGQMVDSTLFPSEFKEIVRDHIKSRQNEDTTITA